MKPIQILVATYNRTLRGYIAELADSQIVERSHIELEISTFGKWSKGLAPGAEMVESASIRQFARRIALPVDSVCDEVDYLLGRSPIDMEAYMDCTRDGRGLAPRMERATREKLLTKVVPPYLNWKRDRGLVDLNDLATPVQALDDPPKYDVIIVDEAQDLSANQIRTLMSVAAETSP